MNPITIALDVDEICLALMDTWLQIYNEEFSDTLEKQTITDWDIRKFVKPEAYDVILTYIDHPDIFYASKPVEGALEGIQQLREMGFKIVFATANNPEHCKYNWLYENGMMWDKSEFMEVYDKSLVYADVLLDDRFTNCMAFRNASFLYSAPWNRRFLHPNRVDSWKEFIERLKQ
jgi:5'(3')-deoxyribonucleotidase